MTDRKGLAEDLEQRVSAVSIAPMFTEEKENAFEELADWAFQNSPQVIEALRSHERMREALERLRDRYASQAKFADPEPAAYFRDFVAGLNAALQETDNANA